MEVFVLAPAFIVVVVLSIWLAKLSGRGQTTDLTPKKRYLLNAAGQFFALTITSTVIVIIPEGRNDDWNHFALLFCIAAVLPIIIGLTILAVKSLAAPLRSSLTLFARGSILASSYSLIAIPLAIYLFLYISETLNINSLCKYALIRVNNDVKAAKNIAFLSDNFVETSKSGAYGTRYSTFLMNRFSLDYIERPSTEESGLKGKSKYERITIKGNRKEMPKNEHDPEFFIYTPTDELTADYIIKNELIEINDGKNNKVGGANIEIYQNLDNKPISQAKYFWSNNLYKSCPDETKDELFVYGFITKSLGISSRR